MNLSSAPTALHAPLNEPLRAHTRALLPNGSFFSTTDTETALGNVAFGFILQRFNMYMINVHGAYRFDGRTKLSAKSDRYMLLWGKYPP